MTIQEINSSIVSILRGSVSQQVSTDMTIVGGTSAALVDILYNGGAETLTPMIIWVYSEYSDGRSKSIYYPYTHYVSGGGGSNPKAQGTGEYQDMAFTLKYLTLSIERLIEKAFELLGKLLRVNQQPSLAIC